MPDAWQALANACMARDPAQRPTFEAALAAVESKLAEVQRLSAPPAQPLSPFQTVAKAPSLPGVL